MQLQAFEERFADAVERSFRDDAIRTAVLIDDQFPDFRHMRDASENDFKEIERAKNIYAFMHHKGLICDVQNWRTPADADMDLLDKARKSDLILLDYQLGAGGPKTALKILRHLAVSPHFNLVVLYTADASTRVALAAAAAMRGAAFLQVPAQEALDSAEGLLATERFREIDGAGLRQYLTTGKTPWNEDLKEAMREADIPLVHLATLADYIARRWVTTLLDEYAPETDKVLPLGCEIESEHPMWIHCGSCFVAIVGKLSASSSENEGDYVWRHLGTALRTWRPNIYRLILSEIQNALELEAVVDHETWLTDKLSLGLGLYLLESDEAATGKMSQSDIEGSAQSLIDRFVDIIRRRLASHEGISATAIELLSARLSTEIGPARPNERARHVRARELAHLTSEQVVDWKRDVLPAVNAFMVSDAFRGGHITTGTVLRGCDERYWLCASPACDLVPRTGGPVIAQLIKLERTGGPQDKFTQGDFVVIGAPDEVIILRAIEKAARQPSLKMLILPDGTRVRREAGGPAMISGWIATEAGLRAASVAHGFPVRSGKAADAVEGALETAGQHLPGVTMVSPTRDDQKTPSLNEGAADGQSASTQTARPIPLEPIMPGEFVVVSQLRSSFATRFLMAAGQHQSRVGVDFVDP